MEMDLSFRGRSLRQISDCNGDPLTQLCQRSTVGGHQSPMVSIYCGLIDNDLLIVEDLLFLAVQNLQSGNYLKVYSNRRAADESASGSINAPTMAVSATSALISDEEERSGFFNNDIDHIRAIVHGLIIGSVAMVVRSPIVVITGATGGKVGVSGTNSYHSADNNSGGDNCADTRATPNTPVPAATATMPSSPPSSGLGLTDCNKIVRVHINLFDMNGKTNCKKA
jgi:hypothetical protein